MEKNFKLPLLAFLCIGVLLFTHCKSDDNDDIPVLQVKQKNISFIQQGESKAIGIDANNQWKAAIPDADKEWLTLSQSASELNITAKENNKESLRKTTITVTSAGLSEKIEVSQFGLEIEIIGPSGDINLTYSDTKFDFIISSNTTYDIIINESVKWLREIDGPSQKSLGLTDKRHYFECDPNYTGTARQTELTVKQKDGEKTTTILIYQKTFGETDDPLPVGDTKIEVKKAWASSEYGSDAISNSIDGDYSSIWHSDWSKPTTWPINAIYYFENVDYMDYLKYTPRTTHTNGNFKELKLYVSYEQNPDFNNAGHWQYIDQYDFEGTSTPSEIEFIPALENPTAIRFEILSGMGDNDNGFASCAEMEFYKKQVFDVDLSLYFVDDICSEVKPGITEDAILKSDLPHFFKNLAIQLLSGDYSPYRVNEYEAYRPVSDLAKELKTSGYNQHENPTGIWFEEEKDVYVFVPDTKGEKLSLILRNWANEKEESFSLKKGINLIKPTIKGLSYISYYTKNYETADPVRIHVAGGKINGYFDREKNEAREWSTILNEAVGDYFDILGNYTNLVFHVASLKSNCPEEGMKLIEYYDEIIEMQFEQMGLIKYNKVPKNHMLAMNSSNPDHFMHAGGLGAVFHYNTMNSIGKPSSIVSGDNSWGIAHEYGHVNQIRPTLKWVGTAECTNNIYSSYAQYMLTSKYSTLHLRLEHENCADIQGGASVIGGRFNSHLHYGVLERNNWLFQWGQDGESDHFVKLVPLWQLNLYFKIVEGTSWSKPDWYGDICEEARNTNDNGISNGQHQINFMKMACKYTETDLVEFFEKAGMLKTIDKEIEDYGKQQLTITESMCKEVRDYVKTQGWQKPEGIINYISGNTVNIYKNKLSVQGTLNQGISGSGLIRTVNHNSWKNAVVFETYAGEKLVRITMAGTGSTNNSSTIVPYPSDATKIVAVAWNGESKVVYQP